MGAERIEVTHESSMAVYDSLLRNPPPGPLVPFRPPRENAYTVDGRDIVAVVKADSRREGIEEALRLMGGVEPARAELECLPVMIVIWHIFQGHFYADGCILKRARND